MVILYHLFTQPRYQGQVEPLAGAELFKDRAVAVHNKEALHLYDGHGTPFLNHNIYRAGQSPLYGRVKDPGVLAYEPLGLGGGKRIYVLTLPDTGKPYNLTGLRAKGPLYR